MLLYLISSEEESMGVTACEAAGIFISCYLFHCFLGNPEPSSKPDRRKSYFIILANVIGKKSRA